MAGVSSIPFGDGELRIYVDDLATLPTIGNVDVEVLDGEQCRWGATFFTLDGIETLFQKNGVTGECAGGTYFWASDMILAQSLSLETIQRTVRALQENGEFQRVFAPLPEE